MVVSKSLPLLTHRFPTHIIRGSPDLFAFYTLPRIRMTTTFAHCTNSSQVFWGWKTISKKEKQKEVKFS
jgi:hypothetical protein